MLKYINYQILDNNDQQEALEKQVSVSIGRNIRQNIDAFRQHIPSLVGIINDHEVQQYSLFCTKDAELNIVDFATGRVFYQSTAKLEVMAEVQDYYSHAAYFNLQGQKDDLTWRHQALPAKVDVLLVFGLGLGYHLNELVMNSHIRYLVVYEPNVDILLCSAQANNWQQLLDTATSMGTHIFLQIGSDATAVPAELAELLEFDQTLDKIFVYRHQFHPMMDDVIRYLLQHSGDKDALTNTGHQFTEYKDYADYVSERAGNLLGHYKPQDYKTEQAHALYNANMEALQKFYPKVHKAMQEHKTRAWQLVSDPQGNPNLYHQKRNALFHQDLEAESAELVEYFVNHPFKDDVVLNQRVSSKYKSYLHFSKVAELQPLIDKALNQQSQLPVMVNTLIVFGVALGKHIERLTEQHQIKNLFICEPNLDFFAASLWVTDWAGIFAKADGAEGRIYLNLGGDGSHYFYDLMAQFYQIGAYSIADTYMLSTYFNIGMQKAISDLRSELKVVLALGEYYDHARFGIAHTHHSVFSGQRFLQHSNAGYKNHVALNLPVFVVGNGPSLDHCFDYLKEYRDRAIVISCGTALRSLHRNGIQPDFHAEIEQNRATFDWITQIDDTDYLKGIRLLSVNGIHPDTAALFKETLLCFKDGEASTYVFHNGLKKRGFNVASLAYAYPTVTNLVMNYAIKLGFKHFYLFGVDLGFIDINQHHSQHSSYYKADGSQVYNYQLRHGGGVPSTGNFRPMVYTKPEFDVSRKLLEQAISKAGRKIEVYNCSDGVKIKGTIALQPENILLEASGVKDKEAELAGLLTTAYFPAFPELAESIYAQFDTAVFESSMQQWLDILQQDAENKEDATALIEKQWQFLRKRAVKDNDITFCLFHGSANYMAGVLTKLAANITEDSSEFLQTFNQVLALWRGYLLDGQTYYMQEPFEFDGVSVQYLFKPVKQG
ncbi:MAG TPA: 6-hydroxymethylpterin diphosphokinase MptE-like protein [Rheinheimera sp.]|uniref:6-hydroxymethylpterin diphosphokinase MptE-like protein n=1 Tax=Rheinheimera sp. TaxID=1869214 RepID=UPI002B4A0457|nr:6-hydroxymethylpterin diphosphokinase MptE-like protein [Rheinheimera sp.]HJS15147.1 6-hydroxymethylpterin diphosphokinase MptE-like protein [Rheinheimera sp.]